MKYFRRVNYEFLNVIIMLTELQPHDYDEIIRSLYFRQALLDSKPPIIGADTVEKIFYKISAILQCHQLFQMALASAARHWDEEERIGDTFVASVG